MRGSQLGPLLGLALVASCRGGDATSPSSGSNGVEPATSTAMVPAGTSSGPSVLSPDLLLLPGVAPGGGASSVELPPVSERPPCAKDEDCWSLTCCPAVQAEQCVHGSLAPKCALIDIKCAKSDTHYDCLCLSGQCQGRLHS